MRARDMKDLAGAEQAYRKALEADPRAADAANGMAVLLVQSRRAPEAIQCSSVRWSDRLASSRRDSIWALRIRRAGTHSRPGSNIGACWESATSGFARAPGRDSIVENSSRSVRL
jgi:Tfp pilus assembly protein PilF